MSYINGTARGQSVLFPRTLDDYLDENNAVRAIDAFIEYLPFDKLGFSRVQITNDGELNYPCSLIIEILLSKMPFLIIDELSNQITHPLT